MKCRPDETIAEGDCWTLWMRGSAGKTTSSDDCFRWVVGAALVGSRARRCAGQDIEVETEVEVEAEAGGRVDVVKGGAR